MARQSPACDPAPYPYSFTVPFVYAPRRGDAPNDVERHSLLYPSPPLNQDVLPPHPNSCRWATPSGRPPMAFLEPPPPSDAVTHSAELFSRLAQLEQKSRTPSPEWAEQGEARAASTSRASSTLRAPGRAASPVADDLPPPDPSAHPGFSSLPFWVPPRDSPASVYYEPKAAARARSSEPTRDHPAAPADAGCRQGRVAHPLAATP
ncbi:hypothetical protein HDZ31DRAFT_83217 [Schizophyllum fasciatum]